ncbi:hypothetical protein PSQ20_00160 [Curvibacter sp. RS43]|uniref:hypothetical protein n=1 Tax=Curvibacter microcysteis TaxID=3026419 RepID=UPI002361F9A1|nr:hypothetical protein [Curvibacter sp. RS43]MDD0808736.1 hypothetical protein [Curvibacter sp. RS43]
MKLSFLLATLLYLPTAEAKCILPSPDGGTPNVSNRNIAGLILIISDENVWINDVDRGKPILVKLSGKIEIFTAFGGGGDSWEVLNVGQSARVWLKKCKYLPHQNNFAAYFEVFSYDPSDFPPKDYFFIQGQ